MWSTEIELGNWTESIVNFEPVKSITYKTVYADEKSVRQSEHYNGVSVGRKPELMYEVRSIEFSNHEKVRIGGASGKVYDITRSFKKGDITELILSAPVGRDV